MVNIFLAGGKEKKMSTLEKTIDMLSDLPESQIEIIYSYVQFVYAQQLRQEKKNPDDVNEILASLAGVLPDSGKTLEQYRDERVSQRYEIAD